jgi:hypothetical protein
MADAAVRLGILLAVAVSGCYSPYQPDCGFICGADGACPADYTCAADRVCHRNGTSPNTVCSQAPLEFDVSSAMALRTDAVSITFSGVPNPAEAQALANYDIPGLTLAGNSMLAGSMITIGTSAQAAMTYTVTVTGVTRLTDGQPLTMTTATFTGRTPFEVLSAAPMSTTSLVVTYNDPPDAGTAGDIGNYTIAGLGVSGTATLAGNAVTLTTDPQGAQLYNLTVSNVKRASDFEPLHVSTAQFTGRAAFDVLAAATADATHVSVTFDAAPETTAATTPSNYTIPGLVVSAAALTGSVVTLTTDAQVATSYTVTVANVTRSSDAEPLTTAAATFTGTDHCSDGMFNGNETDVDCGGPTCTARCANTQMCVMNTDCTSNNCAGTTCAP